MTGHSAPTQGEVTQGDIDRADKVGWLTMERRMIVAEEFRAHRLATIEECAKVAETLFTPHGYPAVARNAGKSIADQLRNLVRAA